ncbi:MAG: hypothetical protein KAG20_03515 [Cocleimonas sp.]|nr:hypothetical protein [Cocleimonas sp.]
MSNPYQRKALLLATSFVIAGAALSSTTAISAEKLLSANKLVEVKWANKLKLRALSLSCDPRVCNPAALKNLNVKKRLKALPVVVNPAALGRVRLK